MLINTIGGIRASAQRELDFFRPEGKARQFFDDRDCFQRYGDDFSDQLEDVFGIVLVIGIIDDSRPFVGGDAILVDDPVESGAIAQPVFKNFWRDAAECEGFVIYQIASIFAEAHLFHPQGPVHPCASISSSGNSECCSQFR